MPIPPYSGVRTYYVLADVEPKEVMNFGVEEGVPLDEDTTLEVFGHLLACWTVTTGGFDEFRATADDLFAVTLSMYALIRLDRGKRRRTLPLRAVTHSWVEARAVESRANIVGTMHGRYRAGSVKTENDEARDFAAAARAAWRFIRRPTVRVAHKDYALALSDRGDDSFLYAYRAVENVRRTLAPDTVNEDGGFETNWSGMHDILGTSKAMLDPLTEAATCIRHGNTDGTALKKARGPRRRVKTLAIAEDVLRQFARHDGVAW